jgi:6-phosphogluconate dehydrogenase
MGGGMALLFAEHDVTVYLEDPSEEQVNSVIENAKKDGIGHKMEKHQHYQEMCQSLDSPKVFVFSLPHGYVGDKVVDGLQQYLDPGDIIIDASNENWQNTQRRQGKLAAQGVRYIGMGVSGGYQAARRGPSMCPGGDKEALELVIPLLEKVCAKDAKGRPCVGNVGTGGCGHYVKMVHNGIEQGMMSAVAEAFQIMNISLGMTYDEIAEEFAKWNADGELVSYDCKNCFR